MGVVYEAVEESLGRTVALKLVAPERAGEPGFRERFIAESRLAAAIEHPNVLPVFKAGEEDGLLFLAMRFVDGADLRSLSPLDPTRAAHVAAQIGAALDAAHARRLVHRDVKPANVLIAPGDHAYLADFGLVKALDESTAHTGTGTLVGTLDYVAPERIRGESDGPAADLYSLGCVLYFTLTGTVAVPARGHRAQALGAPLRAAAAARLPVRRRDRPRAGQGPGRALRERSRARRRGDRRRGRLAAVPAARRRAALRARHPRRGAGVRRSRRRAAGRLRARRRASGAAARGARRHAAERIERRLAEVRGGQDPGKAKLVAALARHLAVQRRMQAALAAYDADTERILIELETVRGRSRWRRRRRRGRRTARRAAGRRSRRSPRRLERAGGESAT